MSMDIQPGDTVQIIGDSTFGFTDRHGEIAVVHGPCAAVPGSLAVEAKAGTYTDLFPLSSLKLVAKATKPVVTDNINGLRTRPDTVIYT